jgi:hypothetical protein
MINYYKLNLSEIPTHNFRSSVETAILVLIY